MFFLCFSFKFIDQKRTRSNMETSQRRLFLCIRVPEDLADVISTLERPFTFLKEQKEQKSQPILASVKWQRNEKLHITIAFLGDADKDKETSIRTVLRHALGSKLVVPFSLAVHMVVACQTRTLRLLFEPVAQRKEEKGGEVPSSIVSLRVVVQAALHEIVAMEVLDVKEDKDERTSVGGHLTLARLKGVPLEWITTYVSTINAGGTLLSSALDPPELRFWPPGGRAAPYPPASSSVSSSAWPVRPFCEWPRLHVKELCLMSSDSSGFHLVEAFPLGNF